MPRHSYAPVCGGGNWHSRYVARGYRMASPLKSANKTSRLDCLPMVARRQCGKLRIVHHWHLRLYCGHAGHEPRTSAREV